jgi:hypothetical protein
MEIWKEGSFTGNTESYARHIKEALAIEQTDHLVIEHLFPYTGSVRGAMIHGEGKLEGVLLRKDFERHATEHAGNEAFLLKGSIKGT